MPALRSNSSSSLEQIPVPSSTCMSMAVMPLLDLHRKTPGALSSGENPRLLSFSSKSSCQIWAALGSPYRALFSFATLPGVLYHHTSGRICHTPGQDPLHLDDDVTQYMQQGLLRPMVYSSKEVLPSICPFVSIWIASVQICFHLDLFHPSCPPQTKHALGCQPQISQPRPDLWHLSLQRERGKCGGSDGQ